MKVGLLKLHDSCLYISGFIFYRASLPIWHLSDTYENESIKFFHKLTYTLLLYLNIYIYVHMMYHILWVWQYWASKSDMVYYLVILLYSTLCIIQSLLKTNLNVLITALPSFLLITMNESAYLFINYFCTQIKYLHRWWLHCMNPHATLTSNNNEKCESDISFKLLFIVRPFFVIYFW